MSAICDTLKSEPLTDLGNAKRFIERYGTYLRYCIQSGQWFIWSGYRWAVDETGNIDRMAKETVRSMLGEAAQMEDSSRRDALAKHALKSEYEGRIRALISLASTEEDIPVRSSDLDQDPLLLNCLNGTIDLSTGDLREHRPEDLLTKLSLINFDPDAQCPVFDSFVRRITGDDAELIAYIQRCIGYALTGEVGEKALFVLYGMGDNGKTTLLEVIRYLLGDYAGQIPIESLMMKRNDGIPNDIAQLKGLRFVTASEAEQGRKLAEAKVKQITGMGTLQARFLYHEPFEFTPTFKIFMDSNHKPEVRGTDHAIWSRIKLIPFLVSIPDGEKDRHLLNKLKEEAPGILAWAVRGCLEWQTYGLMAPQSVTGATEEYREEMDTFADFLDEECLLALEAETSTRDLYVRLTEWCARQGESRITPKSFGTRLREVGCQKSKLGKDRSWKGIALRPKRFGT